MSQAPTAADEAPVLTVDEAAAYLKVTRRQIYNLIYQGELDSISYPTPSGKGRGLRRIRRSECDAFLKRHERATATS